MVGELCGNFLLGDLSRGRETINLGSGNTGTYTALGFGREKTIIQPLAELYSNINYTAMITTEHRRGVRGQKVLFFAQRAKKALAKALRKSYKKARVVGRTF